MGALFLVVDERVARVGREARDGVEVRQAEQAHEEVGEVPDELQRCEAAEEHHEHDADAEDREVSARVPIEEGDVDLAVVVVAHDGAEGEEEDHEGDGRRREAAEDGGEGCLRERDARAFAADGVLPCEQDDERGRRADDPGVDVDAEGLYEALLDRMRDRPRSRRGRA